MSHKPEQPDKPEVQVEPRPREIPTGRVEHEQRGGTSREDKEHR